MISGFRLKFGRTPGSPGTSIAATPVTVFVGPNNSGKSKVLVEIEQFCRVGGVNVSGIILDNLTFNSIPAAAAEAAIERITQTPASGQLQPPGSIMVGSRFSRMQVNADHLKVIIQTPVRDLLGFGSMFLTHYTVRLDGQSRITLVNQQPAGDLQQPGHSTLQVLFRDDTKRKEVRRIVAEAFGSYFVIDPTNLGTLRIRLAARPPKSDHEERGLDSEAVAFHASAQSIDVASDGVKAFTGIVAEITAGDPKVLLIDEPEAFLHPALASQLGNEISRATVDSGKRVFIATHSSNFVMGCVQSGAPVSIIRLTYRDKVATARLLNSDQILELMQNPLLRSTGVLNGLFYEFVVVTESDADRAFYQEVNERLLRYRPHWGIPNCLFMNAQNKQTIPTILRPLREIGIPAAGIIDIDVLKEGGAVWMTLLSSVNVPELSRHPFAAARAAIKQAMESTGKDMKREGGVGILSAAERESASNLLEQLEEYGLFTVPGGELESWLNSLNANGHGPGWLIEMFERMGSDPTSAGFVKPSDNDVWAFLSRVRKWLVNPNRKGIPA